MIRTCRRLLAFLLLAVLHGCEDDPILEPTTDQSDGGSYGNLAPLTAPSGTVETPNPRVF